MSLFLLFQLTNHFLVVSIQECQDGVAPAGDAVTTLILPQGTRGRAAPEDAFSSVKPRYSLHGPGQATEVVGDVPSSLI